MNEEDTKFLAKIMISISLTATALDELHKILTDYIIQKGEKNGENTDRFDCRRN